MRESMSRAESIDPNWKIGKRNYELLKMIIVQCVEEKSVRITDIDVGAFMIWSTVHGMLSLYIRDRVKMFNELEQEESLTAPFHQFDELLNSI